MKTEKSRKLNISNELLDNMLASVSSQDDLWGQNASSILRWIITSVIQKKVELTGTLATNTPRRKSVALGGTLNLSTPRDRHSSFEPQIIPKRTNGMTVRDIQQTLQELYRFDVSASLISQVTDAVNLKVAQWRDRPLEPLYPVVWLDT